MGEHPTSNIECPTSNGQTAAADQDLTPSTLPVTRGEASGTAKSDRRSDTPEGNARNVTPSPLNPTHAQAYGLVRSSGRPAGIVAFEDAVVSYFVESAEMLGVPKSVAAIYGICFASTKPLSFSEINERLEISSGSISQGLKVLKEVGALRAVPALMENAEGRMQNGESAQEATETMEKRQPAGTSAPQLPYTFPVKRLTRTSGARVGEARSCYTPDLELRNLVLHWIETRLQGQLKSGQDRMRAIVAAVPAGPAGEPLRDRIKHLESWQSKARALLPVMKTFLKLG